MLRVLDDWISSITMYRLVLWGLVVIAAVAVTLGFADILPYSGWQFLASAAVLLAVCWLTNFGLARLFAAAANLESSLITALILFLILMPAGQISDIVTLVLAGVIAMSSKYLLAIRRRHIFNPAAISLVLLGLLGSGQVIWWVGSPPLLPVVAVVGFLILRKIQRFQLFAVFAVTAIASAISFELARGAFMPDLIVELLLSWPLLFFGTVMLTEPSTMPPVHRLRLGFGLLVGVLFGSQFHIGPLTATPEFALVMGNLLAFAASPSPRWLLRLKDKRQLAPGIYEFVFSPDRPLKFQAGQYLEWTLPHRNADNRGNRRYFTLASSPTDPDIRLDIRLDAGRPSSFKSALSSLELGTWLMSAAHVAGDFTLPTDPGRKLIFIAGGIGITPFRSMIAHLLETGQRRDITLFYAANRPDDFAYRQLLDEAAAKLGLKVIYNTGPLAPEVITSAVPDLRNRLVYISGPQAMVRSYKIALRATGLPSRQIRTDYFPGF